MRRDRAGRNADQHHAANFAAVDPAQPNAGEPWLDACEQHCERRRCDVLLQRTGLYPETLDPVTVEVALIMDELAVFVPGLVYMRHRNRSLWLVPQQVGPYIEVSENGLAVSSVPPFVTWDERTDGVCRAAAEIVRLVRRRGH